MTSSPSRTAVVVGAAGVTGLAVARRLVADGYRVAVADAVGLEEARTALADLGDAVLGCFEIDLRSEGTVRELRDTLADLVPHVDAVVVVAGVLQDASTVADLAVEEWDRVMSVNLRGPFLAAKWLAPLLAQAPAGAVVNVGSWWGYEGHAFFSAYCASKAGLRVFTQALAEELAPQGTRVNLVAPGNIDTPMHHRALRAEADKRGIELAEMQRLEWDKIPLGKPAEPEQVAAAVSFLVGPDSSYVTGSVVDVNGGVVFR